MLNFHEIETFYGCLATQHGLGPVGFARLTAALGSPEAVYAAGPDALRETHPRLAPAVAASIARGPRPAEWEALAADCAARGIVVTAPERPGYPGPVAALDAPPPLLYLRGAWLPADARAVAIVGTRAPTAYGREAAHALARDLAEAGCTIISGLAVGVDAAAHRGALASPDGRTLAVIGCGHDIPYPAENLALRTGIEARGAVVSEFPPGTEPRAAFFPRRNRLISALARAVVVVEAGERSGALLTAAQAREQGRALFAVPGPIFSPASAGTHALLRGGVPPAACAADVLAALDEGPAARETPRTPRPKPAPVALAAPAPVDPALRPLLELWEGDAACAMDTLAARAVSRGLWPRGEAASALSEALLKLELRGIVRRLPGAAYRLTGRGP